MKTLAKFSFFILLALGATAGNATTPISSPELSVSVAAEHETKQLTQREANALVGRIYEIRSMDLNALSSIEKRELRDEVTTINKQLRDPLSGGVYISVGALIVILILLIILT